MVTELGQLFFYLRASYILDISNVVDTLYASCLLRHLVYPAQYVGNARAWTSILFWFRFIRFLRVFEDTATLLLIVSGKAVRMEDENKMSKISLGEHFFPNLS